jgi:hypothetical protein
MSWTKVQQANQALPFEIAYLDRFRYSSHAKGLSSDPLRMQFLLHGLDYT